MNLILFEADELAAHKRLILSGERAQHLREVCKLVSGDTVRVGEIGGLAGSGRVVRLGEDEVEIEVEELTKPTSQLPVSLVLALPRPQMLKRIFELVGALGVRELHLIRTSRVEKSFFSSPLLRKEQIVKHLRLGMEQGMTTCLPQVTVHPLFRPFVEEGLEQIPGTRVLAHLGGEKSFRELGALEEVCIALGPEGGWIPFELEALQERGFSVVTLSEAVLRVESAVHYALAQYELMRR